MMQPFVSLLVLLMGLWLRHIIIDEVLLLRCVALLFGNDDFAVSRVQQRLDLNPSTARDLMLKHCSCQNIEIYETIQVTKKWSYWMSTIFQLGELPPKLASVLRRGRAWCLRKPLSPSALCQRQAASGRQEIQEQKMELRWTETDVIWCDLGVVWNVLLNWDSCFRHLGWHSNLRAIAVPRVHEESSGTHFLESRQDAPHYEQALQAGFKDGAEI